MLGHEETKRWSSLLKTFWLDFYSHLYVKHLYQNISTYSMLILVAKEYMICPMLYFYGLIYSGWNKTKQVKAGCFNVCKLLLDRWNTLLAVFVFFKNCLFERQRYRFGIWGEIGTNTCFPSADSLPNRQKPRAWNPMGVDGQFLSSLGTLVGSWVTSGVAGTWGANIAGSG